MIWCYADYIPELWSVHPCLNYHHATFLRLRTADGSPKPHAKVMRDFALTEPKIKPMPDYAKFEVDRKSSTKIPPFLLDSYRQYLEGIVPASTS